MSNIQDLIKRGVPMSIKEKLQATFGVIGGILFYFVTFSIYILPLVMINASFWLDLLFFAILYFFPVSSIVFWIWGLVCAIIGPQDIWAIIYYILFVVMWIPFFVSTIIDLFFSDK
jgi:hypothetical protein